MRWTFVIQQKLKAACLLMGAMLAVIVFSLIEQRNIKAMNSSVSSIYNDRLVPATDIFYLTESLYSKRYAIKRFLSAQEETDIKALYSELAVQDAAINKLVQRFEKTYLVNQESVFLKEFKQKAAAYAQFEKRIARMAFERSKAEAAAVFESEGEVFLMGTISKLSDLAKIQTEVGGELMNNSNGILASSDFLSSMQMVLAVLIGALCVSLIAASKITGKTNTNFNLN